MSQRPIHDNNIYAFQVCCRKRRIALYTEFESGEAHEYTDIIFEGVVAHHFASVLSGNILFAIDEVNAAEIIDRWRDLFIEQKSFGWPEIEYDALDELSSILVARRVKGYVISSSYGLSGFVLAETMTHRSAGERPPSP